MVIWCLAVSFAMVCSRFVDLRVHAFVDKVDRRYVGITDVCRAIVSVTVNAALIYAWDGDIYERRFSCNFFN